MTKATIDYNEKRREKRFPINSTVTITVPPGKTTVTGTCSNISGSGLLIHANKAIAENKQVLIDILEGKIEFSAEAIIVRCQEADDGAFDIGIKVTNQLK